jgi:PAS domain S-box-containing protein
MAERIGAFDWAGATTLGPAAAWPAALRTPLTIMLGSNQPMFALVGNERCLLYNDSFTTLLGSRHPGALGEPWSRVLQEARNELAPLVERAFSGEPVWQDNVQLLSHERGRIAQKRFSFAFTPLTSETGQVLGVFCTCNEIGKSNNLQRRLRHANQILELAWEAARGAVYEHAVPAPGQPVYFGEQWADILGYDRAELPATEDFLDWVYQHIHPDDRALVEERYRAFMAGRRPGYRVEVRMRHKDGDWVWIRGVNRALERNDDGSVRRMIAMALDITDLKRVEEALRASEMQFREMANGLPAMVWVCDADGQLALVNDTYCEFFGISRAQIHQGTWATVVHPDEVRSYLDELFACLREQRPFHAQARFRRADGQWRWMECWAKPRLDGAGGFCGLIGTSMDVTDRKRAEDALREQEERFRTLADNIAQLAWMADREGRIIWCNRRWLDYTGLDAAAMAGDGWQQAHHPDHLERVEAKIRRCFEDEEPWEDTFPLRGKDGRYRWFLSRALPIHDEAGELVRWIGTNTDVTEQREYAERLREAERQTSEFLAMLGHELRNPLAAVRSAAELVSLAEPEDPRLQRAWVVLERQSTHMTRLIDSLLEVSRIARGKITLDRRTVDLRRVLEGVLQDRSAQLAGSGLELEKSLPRAPVWVSGDDVRLAQIFDNLLGNAIKFTPPPGRVSIALGTEHGHAVAHVRDTGAGIRPEMLGSIFEPFQQDTQDISRSAGGLGLGLALVKGLVELHDGSVEAHSSGPGSGAELTVRLPLSAAPSAPVTPTQPEGPPRRRILIVEDNVDAAEMLQFVLELQGHEVTVAVNGTEGLELLRLDEPDVVLCDIGLPGMSGYEFARAVRADPMLGDVVLVALTGYGRAADRRRTEEAGFDAHLTKPVELAALDEVLAGLASRRPGAGPPC